MEYSEIFLKSVAGCGCLGYPLSKIINVLEIDDEAAFTQDFDDENSAVYKAFKKGIDLADYEIDQKLLQLSKEGNLKALDDLEKRKAVYFSSEKAAKFDRKKVAKQNQQC